MDGWRFRVHLLRLYAGFRDGHLGRRQFEWVAFLVIFMTIIYSGLKASLVFCIINYTLDCRWTIIKYVGETDRTPHLILK